MCGVWFGQIIHLYAAAPNRYGRIERTHWLQMVESFQPR